MKPSLSHNPDTAPQFWRDTALPFIEARSIADGRKVCYARHAHEHFSIGAITAGHSTYLHEQAQFRIGAGTVVLMNPGEVHACNPIDDQPWSYLMLYVDTPWLTDLQHQLGFSQDLGFRAFSTPHSDDPELYAGLNRLYEVLVDEQAETLHKHSAVVAFFSDLQQRLNPASRPPRASNQKLQRAADYIRQLHPFAEARGNLPGRRAVAVLPDPRLQAALRHDAPRLRGQPAGAVRPVPVA